MNYRYMRTIIFFDLPSVTTKDRRNYRNFVKSLRLFGFYRIQESVFVKMSLNQQASELIINKIRNSLPLEGVIMALTVTEKQFNSMIVLLGESKTDVIDSDERMIVL